MAKIFSNKNNLQVLYEDNHIIIVNKRSGDIVQGDKTGDAPLSEVVKEYIAEKYNKPGNVYLGVVHRLDRPTTVDKEQGQMIQQLRMRRPFSGQTKVVDRSHQPDAEQMLPDAIHGYACRQWILFTGNPLSQLHSTTRIVLIV